MLILEKRPRANSKGQGPAEAHETAPKPTRALNVSAVLDLGNLVFYQFRGRAYGVPPLSPRLGRRALTAYLDIEAFGARIAREDVSAYYDTLEEIKEIAWRAMRPVGKLRRLLRFLGLHRNPFNRATEVELMGLVLFLAGYRTHTGVPASLKAKPSPSITI